MQKNEKKEYDCSVQKHPDINNEGDPVEQYLMGLAYLNGDGVEKNKEKAIELLSSSIAAKYHEMTRPALELLIRVYKNEHNNDMLSILYKQMSDYLFSTHGEDNIDALDYQVKLALCYKSKGRKDEAMSLMTEAYDRKCELLGENSPSTVRTLCANLKLYNTSDGDAFFDMIDEAGEKIDAIKDIDDENVVNALYNYASVLDDFYGHSAFSVYEEIRDWVQKFKGPGSDDYLHILSELGDIYYELELYDEAIETGEEFYSYACDNHGAEDKYTLAIYENLAKVYFFNENFDEAALRLKKLADVYERQEKEPKILAETYYNMALCYYCKKDFDNAINSVQKSCDLCALSGIENDKLTNYSRNLLFALKNKAGHMFMFTRWQNIWGIMN